MTGVRPAHTPDLDAATLSAERVLPDAVFEGRHDRYDARRARTAVRYGPLVLLLAASAVFNLSESSGAQGGLATFYTLPFQCVVAVGAAHARFSRRR